MNFEQPVSAIMTSQLVTVAPEDRLTKIRQIFETNTFHHIPVVDKGMLVGIISKSDFYRLSHTLSFTWDGKEHIDNDHQVFTAGQIMTRYPMQLQPEDTISLAADIFLANRFHALPVVEGETLVGIVTSHDLIAVAFGNVVFDDVINQDFSDI